MYFVFLAAGIVLIPSFSFAWGPLTHMYLGSEIFSYAPLIPAGLFALLKKHRQDFLYGNFKPTLHEWEHLSFGRYFFPMMLSAMRLP